MRVRLHPHHALITLPLRLMFTVWLEVIATKPTAEKGGAENGNSPVRTAQLPHSCGGQEGELAAILGVRQEHKKEPAIHQDTLSGSKSKVRCRRLPNAQMRLYP